KIPELPPAGATVEGAPARAGARQPPRSEMFLRLLLVFVPIAIVQHWLHASPTLVFICACLAIIPLADLLAGFTEHLREHLGPTLGGLVSGTLGNAPELIISGFALNKGLSEVVKASISGSILMNLLLALGMSMIAGGLRYRVQLFDMKAAGMASALLTLAAVALIVPAGVPIGSPEGEEELSLGISGILFVMYLLSMVFALTAPKDATKPRKEADITGPAAPRPALGKVIAQLVGTVLVLAWISQIMTEALDPAIKALGFSELF